MRSHFITKKKKKLKGNKKKITIHLSLNHALMSKPNLIKRMRDDEC